LLAISTTLLAPESEKRAIAISTAPRLCSSQVSE
jgi:hypothetical protein